MMFKTTKTLAEPLVIGKSLTAIQQEAINKLKKQIRKLKKEIKELKKNQKPKQHWMLDKVDNPFYRG